MHKVHSCPFSFLGDGATTLMVAASHGDIAQLEKNLDQAGSCNARGQTALMLAAENGNEEATKALARVESTLVDSSGRTALMYALDHDHSRCAKILAEKEAGKQDEDGETALMHAVKKNNYKLARLLARWEGGHQNAHGMTALMMAAQSNHAENTRLLLPLEKGCQDERGWTALMMAADAGNVMRVNLLTRVEAGIIDKTAETALMKAARNGHNNCVKILAKREGRKRNDKGFTALMIAASMGYSNCVKTLLFETGLRNAAKETALIISIKSRHDACVDILLPHEGEFPDARGENALFWAIRNNDLTYIDKLISYLKKRRTAQGKTALMLAVELHNIPAIQRLLPHEARLCDNKGRTALMYAAELGDTSLAALLVKHEAGMLDVYGRTALMRAMKHGYTDCFNALLPHEILVRSGKGLSVLDFCLKWSLEDASDFEDANDDIFSFSELDCGSTGSPIALGSNLNYNEIAVSKIKLMENEYISMSTPCLQFCSNDSIDENNPQMAPLMQNISFSSNLTPNSEVLSFTTDSSTGIDAQLSLTDLSFASDQLQAFAHQPPASNITKTDSNILLGPAHVQAQSSVASFLSRTTLSDLPDATTSLLHPSNLPQLPLYASAPTITPLVVHTKEAGKQATGASNKLSPIDTTPRGSQMQSKIKQSIKNIGLKLSLLGKKEKKSESSATTTTTVVVSAKKPSVLRAPRHRGLSVYTSSDSESESDAGLGIIAMESESTTPSKTGNHPLSFKGATEMSISAKDAITPGIMCVKSVPSFSDSSSLPCVPSSHSPAELVGRGGVRIGEINMSGSKPISRIYSLSRLSKATKDDIDEYRTQISVHLGKTNQRLILTPRSPTVMTTERTMLMECAAKGDVNGVQQHLSEMGAMCMADGDSSGATALMLAVIEGNINVIPYLLNELGIVNKKGYTALIYAAQDGLEEGVLLLLLEAGMKNQTGRTALIQAAAFGYASILPHLIPWEAGVCSLKSQTALMRAAQNGHFRCVDILKESPKEIRQVDKDGRTALWKAASDGHIECTAMLAPLESKIVAKDGTTALIMAAERGHTMCVRLLTTWEARLSDKTHTTALMYAARTGNVECVRILAPLEQRMRRVDGTTALIVSIRARKPECTKLLLAEANMRSGSGETVLSIAKKMNSMACHQVILDAKA